MKTKTKTAAILLLFAGAYALIATEMLCKVQDEHERKYKIHVETEKESQDNWASSLNN